MKALLILWLIVIASACSEVKNTADEIQKLNALIIDGQNNHYIWPKTTMMMKSYLEQTGLFKVDINRVDSVWLGIKYNQNRDMPLDGYIKKYPIDSTEPRISDEPVKSSSFEVDFSKYDLIISNLGAMAAEWPDVTKRKFEQNMQEGGGFVVVHAANNAWGDWTDFNKMIGLGAWGDRDSISCLRNSGRTSGYSVHVFNRNRCG